MHRPISLLSTVSNKVLERRIFLNIKHHLWQLTNKCVTNLLEVFDYIGKILDNEGQVDTISISIWQRLLIELVIMQKLIIKLRNYGFGGSLLKWLQSY